MFQEQPTYNKKEKRNVMKKGFLYKFSSSVPWGRGRRRGKGRGKRYTHFFLFWADFSAVASSTMVCSFFVLFCFVLFFLGRRKKEEERKKKYLVWV